MPVHDACGIVLKPHQADKAAPDLRDAGLSRNLELLVIRIDGRLGFGDEDAMLDPIAKIELRARVKTLLRGVCGCLPPPDDTHQVVRAQFIVACLHLRTNLVVRLSDYLVECGDAALVVMQCSKGTDFGHRFPVCGLHLAYEPNIGVPARRVLNGSTDFSMSTAANPKNGCGSRRYKGKSPYANSRG